VMAWSRHDGGCEVVGVWWCGVVRLSEGTSPPVNPACCTTRVVLEARRFCEPAWING
jgi:hypothetical protein